MSNSTCGDAARPDLAPRGHTGTYICDPTQGQSCPACDGTYADDVDDLRPEPCAYRYPGWPAEYCCEDAIDGTPYCGMHIDDPADPDRAYDLYRDLRDLSAA